jgi:class 3 adenylate cyclase
MSQSRQLATIIFADIVGYTELMNVNEDDALRKLNHFKKATEARVGENLGRIIQYYGDGCLVIFKSPLDAVAFAKILQEDCSVTRGCLYVSAFIWVIWFLKKGIFLAIVLT